MTKPNVTTSRNYNCSAAAADRSANEVTISLNWNKPTQPGFFSQT